MVDVERPAEVVLARGEGDVTRRLEEDRTVVRPGDARVQSGRQRRGLTVFGTGGVERETEAQPATLLGRLDADATQPGQSHRSRLDHAHRAPKTTRARVGIENVPVGESTGGG